MYKKKISYCLNHKHLDNKILKTNTSYTWRLCNLCGLIYSEVKNKKHRNYTKKLKIFDDFSEGRSSEFIKILKRVEMFDKNLNKKKWFDFGCGSGKELELVKQNNLIGTGFEPNKLLFKKCRKKKLSVYNKINNVKKKFDFIFTKNTFKYVENFPKNISRLSSLLKKGGILIWRDKYFDYMPIKNYMDDINETMVTSTFLKKNVIKNYLFFLNFEILLSKFYFDESFFIIARKRNKFKKINDLNSSKFKIKNSFSNYYFLTISRKILFRIYVSARKLKNFFYQEK